MPLKLLLPIAPRHQSMNTTELAMLAVVEKCFAQ
jgi:hypothetical protein